MKISKQKGCLYMHVYGAKEQILVCEKYPISEANLPRCVPVVIRSSQKFSPVLSLR